MEKSPEDITSFLTFRHPISALEDYKYPCELNFDEIEISFKEATDKIAVLLFDAVKKYVYKSEKPAVMMSAGPDSVLIARLVKALCGVQDKEPIAYTATFLLDEEIKEAKKIARKIGIKHKKVMINPEDYLETERWLIPLIEHKGEPLHPNEIALAKCESIAKEDGCDMVFCGEGADDIFGGYSNIFTFHKGRYFDQGRFKITRNFLTFYRYFSVPDRKRIVHWKYLVSDYDMLESHFRGLTLKAHDFGAYFVQKFHTPGLIKRGVNAIIFNGLKPAFPYQDPKLVKFVNTLPLEYKVFGSISKYIFREMALRYIPYESCYHQKHPFPIPFDYFFRNKIYWDLSEDLFIVNNFKKMNAWHKWMVINLDEWWKMQ